jgi:hypothetical protein
MIRRVRRETRRYRKAGPKLRALSWRDWKDLGRAQLALVRAQRILKSLPKGEMVRDEEPPAAMPAVLDRLDEARRIALAVNRAAEFGLFRPRCLVRSMALRSLLNRAGIEGAYVRVGVQLVNERFMAHAWVEYAGQIVGDNEASVGRFVPLTTVQVMELE